MSKDHDHSHGGHDHDHSHGGDDHDHSHGGDDHDHSHGGHDHDHGGGFLSGHSHSHDLRGASKRNLWWALGLIAGYMFVEVIGGVMSGSLALLSDAGHMATDAASIGLALLAMHFAERAATAERTFGYQRLEILAALVNALSLWFIVGMILLEAYKRLNTHDFEVEGPLMLIVGSIGLLVNVVAALILARSAGHSVNVEGAYQHVMADLLGSVAVVISGVLIWQFADNNPNWYLADPIVSVVLSLIILRATWGLLKKIVHVLLEGAPAHIDVNELCHKIEMVPHVTLIHDIHVWTISEGSEMMSAHILVDKEYKGSYDAILEKLRAIATGEFGIGHVTMQLETTARQCQEETHHVDHLLTEWYSVAGKKKKKWGRK